MTTTLARIAAVTPQRDWKVGERRGLVRKHWERAGARSSSGEPDQAPEKNERGWECKSVRVEGLED